MRKLSAILGLGLALLLLYGLQQTLPTYGDITSPIVQSGKAGETLTARDFEFTVKNIRLARRIGLSSFGAERFYDTSGIWAVVEVEAAARNKTVVLTSATWVGPDRVRYSDTERLSNAPGLLASRRLEPGLPAKALLIFEFPENELRGSSIFVARQPFQPLDSELHIATDIGAKPVIHPLILLTRGRSVDDWTLTTP